MKANKSILVVIAILFGIAVEAQSYQSSRLDESQRTAMVSATPSAQFQSTSTMQGVGSSYSSTPTLGTGGTANNPFDGWTPSGPRYVGENPFGDQTIGDLVGDPEQPGTPIGDAVLPLCLFALAYVGIVALRRRRALKR